MSKSGPMVITQCKDCGGEKLRPVYKLPAWEGRCNNCARAFNSRRPELKAIKSANAKALLARIGKISNTGINAPKGSKHYAYKGPKPQCLTCSKTLSVQTSSRCLEHKNSTEINFSRWSLETLLCETCLNPIRIDGGCSWCVPVAATGSDNHSWKGGKPSCEVCNKELKNYGGRYCREHQGITTGGEKHWQWKGGVTPEAESVRKSPEYIQWRSACLKRDKNRCQNCGVLGRNAAHEWILTVDHIKPFSLFPDLRFDVNNGRTLCNGCDNRLGWNYFRDLPRGVTMGMPLEQHYWREAATA